MRPKWQILLIIFLFLFVPISVLADDLEITGSDVAIRSLPGTNGKVLARKSHGATFPLRINFLIKVDVLPDGIKSIMMVKKPMFALHMVEL